MKYGDLNHDGILSADEKMQAGNLRYVYYFILSSHIIIIGDHYSLRSLHFAAGISGTISTNIKSWPVLPGLFGFMWPFPVLSFM